MSYQPSPGLHHVTAISGDPRINSRFYTETLGLRRVKKTVNFDDPGTYASWRHTPSYSSPSTTQRPIDAFADAALAGSGGGCSATCCAPLPMVATRTQGVLEYAAASIETFGQNRRGY